MAADKMTLFLPQITFVANYIPNVGAIVATLVPLPVVILGGWEHRSITYKYIFLGCNKIFRY